MTKYYFISYRAYDDCKVIHGCSLRKVTDKSMIDIANMLADKHGVKRDSVVITCLRSLDKDEYEMLRGKKE